LISHPTAPSRLPAGGLLVLLVLVAAVAAAGVGVAWAANPAPTGAFAKCRSAAQVAPRVYKAAPAICIDTNKPYSATILTTKGDVTVAFLVGSAPITVNNFIVLAVNGYYNGLRFFQITDWYVQTGDPLNNGHGGPGYTLPEEPAPDDTWAPGSLGMARLPEGISGGQAFITKQPWPGGNPTIAYNHFATVSLGFDILAQLTTDDRILRIDVKRG
jgi:cyclophilin family peptidyl-prolyl cis-trans isomerase